MSQFASAVYPVPNRFINLGKEPAGQPGTVAAATFTFPMTTFKPVDKVTYLEDNAWRNAMAELYNMIQGVQIADISMGGPVFLDGIGYVLTDILGDYWQAVNGTQGSKTSLSGTTAIGATSIVVANAGGISTNTIISIDTLGSTLEEVRKVLSVTGSAPGTLTLNSALYQGHASAGTVIAYTVVNSFVHNWSLLNAGLGAGGWTASQPPTYTYTDFTGVPAVTGARNYAYTCFSEVTISGEATGLVMWDAKATALASQIAPSTPVTQLSTVQPQASWRSTVAIAGSGTGNTADWKLTLTRKISPKFDNNGQADPFAIPRGAFGAAMSWTFDPASDEAEYLYYRNNTQPTAQIVAANGLSGAAAGTLTITGQVNAMDTSELDDSKDVFGYANTAKLVANTTNAGPSGGFSPVQVQIVNQVTNY